MRVKHGLRDLGLGLSATIILAAIVACGGGGGTPGPNPLPPIQPTTAPQTYAVSGTVNGCDSTYLGAVEPTPSPAPQTLPPCTPDTALSGATVTLGQMPSSTCSGQSCAAPLNPLPAQTTAPNGTFAFAGVPAGTYMIVISNGMGYAVLHQAVTVPTSGALSYKLSALSSTEQAWLVDVNAGRAKYGATTPAVIDENAQEVARICAMYMANGETGHSDPYLCTAPSGNAVDQGGGYAEYVAQYPVNGGLYAWQASYDGGASDYQMADSNVICPPAGPCYNSKGWEAGPSLVLFDPHQVWVGLAYWPDAFDTGSMTNADFIYAEVYH